LKRKTKINPSLVTVAVFLITIGLGVIYGAWTLLKLDLSFAVIAFPNGRLEQVLAVVLGFLVSSLGAITLSLSRRF